VEDQAAFAISSNRGQQSCQSEQPAHISQQRQQQQQQQQQQPVNPVQEEEQYARWVREGEMEGREEGLDRYIHRIAMFVWDFAHPYQHFTLLAHMLQLGTRCSLFVLLNR
jgi:hypothetical protein